MQSIAAPADAEPGSVLLIDQCEEVFSLCQDERERQEFFAAIDEWTERGPVVLAMRADHLTEVRPIRGSRGCSNAACTCWEP